MGPIGGDSDIDLNKNDDIYLNDDLFKNDDLLFPVLDK
jgi:hypothetical protein